MSVAEETKLRKFWNTYKDEIIWAIIALPILMVTIFSIFNICETATDIIQNHSWLSKAVIWLIDIYLLLILLISSLRSSAEYKKRGDKFIWFFPSRPMGLALLFIFLAANTAMFSNLYFSKRSEFCHEDMPIMNKSDAFYFSFGTMAAGSIVDFTPETDSAKRLKAFQIGSDIILFLGAFSFLVSRISTFESEEKTKIISLSPFNRLMRQEFNKENIEQLTGYTLADWCAFSVTSINGSAGNDLNISDFNISGKYPELNLVYNKYDYSLDAIFHLTESKITVANFKTPSTKIFVILFDRFLQFASKNDFKIICRNKYNNFQELIRWKELGFVLNEPKKFSQVMKKDNNTNKPSATSLKELAETEAGFNYWIEKEQLFITAFDVSSNSSSTTAWKDYLGGNAVGN